MMAGCSELMALSGKQWNSESMMSGLPELLLFYMANKEADVLLIRLEVLQDL